MDLGLYAIYLLWDPTDGKIRYVGKAKEPEKRFAAHRRGKGDATRCAEWESWLVKQDLCCQCAIVCEGLGREEANERERWWIELGYKRGWPLTNMKLDFVGEDGPWRPSLGECNKGPMEREWRQTEHNVAWWDAEIGRRWRLGDFEEQDRERAALENAKVVERMLDEQYRLENVGFDAEQRELERQWNARHACG
jgi:predicted GIY-YIG superfamily endonuclease